MRRIQLVTAGCALLLLLLVGVILWKAAPSYGPTRITVAFTGFTNDAAGSRFAAFRVSNASGARLFRWPFYSIAEHDQISGPRWPRLARGGTLSPGESTICLLPAPTNQAPWRAVFAFSQDNWRRRLSGMPSWVRRVVPSRFLGVAVVEGMSEWVGGLPSGPPKAATKQRVAFVVNRPVKPQPGTNAPVVAPPGQGP
jgi:hypothetical protein